MGKLSDYIESQFFIIDSNNLDIVQSKFFGFSWSNENIIYEENLTDEFKLDGEGTYVRILRKANSIEISQDFTGCYGIYLYSHNDCFVISNSFLKLVEYVSDKYPISLNEDVLLSFLPADLCAIQYRQTMINEIEVLPRTYVINIDIENKTFNLENIHYDEQSVWIDSKEGIEILDDWFYKWVSIFRSIAHETNHLQVDLTGGLDSRLVFTILLNSNINLNKICVYSINNEIQKEDYEIASMIANKYDFKLNNMVPKNLIWHDDVLDSINQAYYTRLCYHKHFSFPRTISRDHLYVSGGYGGERLRDYSFVTPQEYTEKCVKLAGSLSEEFKEPTRNVLNSTFKRLQHDSKIDDSSSKLLPQLLFRETKNRNHFGKMSVDFYLTNQIRLSPLLDQNLFKLINEGDLLYALIFVRYCPDLLEIPFDHGKKLDERIINRAREINEKFPIKLKEYSYIDGSNNFSENDYKSGEIKKINPDKFIEEVFRSKSFINLFNTYFSDSLYQKILYQVENRKFQPLSLANCSIALLKIIHLVELNNEVLSKKPAIWLNNFLNIENFTK